MHSSQCISRVFLLLFSLPSHWFPLALHLSIFFLSLFLSSLAFFPLFLFLFLLFSSSPSQFSLYLLPLLSFLRLHRYFTSQFVSAFFFSHIFLPVLLTLLLNFFSYITIFCFLLLNPKSIFTPTLSIQMSLFLFFLSFFFPFDSSLHSLFSSSLSRLSSSHFLFPLTLFFGFSFPLF